MTAATNLLPMAAGVLLLGERLPSAATSASRCGSSPSRRPSPAPGSSPRAARPPCRAQLDRRGWLQPTLPTAAG